MTIATAVIPASPQHWQAGIYKEAIESVKQQTVATDFLVIHDEHSKGAAFARNKGTSQVNTPFVVWLDADDLLHPTFVEETVKKYRRGSFVYTNWTVGDKTAVPPAQLDPFGIGQQHIITTLMPVSAWKDAGGFDESLETLEDEDFYRRIAAYGWIGIHCNKSLVDYRRHLGHSGVNKHSHDPDVIEERVNNAHHLFQLRYGRYRMNYELHRGKTSMPVIDAIGTKQDNDVLCEAIGSPMSQSGPVTGRKYPKAGFNEPIWVDIDDARARPQVWRIIASNPQKISPDPARVVELAHRAKNIRIEIPESALALIDYNTWSMDALRSELKKIDTCEEDVVPDMKAHWSKRKAAMIAYLESH